MLISTHHTCCLPNNISRQTKLFVTSEVPVFQVFADDPTAETEHLSDHMRSVMDDLVSIDCTVNLPLFQSSDTPLFL